MMTRLSGKTALVTGASKGIGRAIALALGGRGAHVLVHYRSGAKEAEALVTQITANGGRADAVFADLLAADGAHRLAAHVRSVIGGARRLFVCHYCFFLYASIEET